MTLLLFHPSSLSQSKKRPWLISANSLPTHRQCPWTLLPVPSSHCGFWSLTLKAVLIAEEREGLHLLESVFRGSCQMNLCYVLVGGCGRQDLMTWIIVLSPLFLLAMSAHVKEAIQLLLFSLRLLVAIKSDCVRFMWIYALLYTE